MELAIGFEPMNNAFAERPLKPLEHANIVNDKVLLTYPAFRFRSVLVRSAFPQMSGLMLFIHPTFLSDSAASDGLSFFWGKRRGTIPQHPQSQCGILPIELLSPSIHPQPCVPLQLARGFSVIAHDLKGTRSGTS